MSSKQMAYAANAGSRLSFHFGGHEVVQGYLCGMDDYHWLVAEVTEADRVITHLIHKGSVRRVQIHREDRLCDEPAHVKAEIDGIGGPFFTWCAGFLARKQNDD